MTPKQNPQTWTGIRFIPFVVATILISSIVALALGAAYGTKLAKAPLDSYKLAHPGAYPGVHHWSIAYFVFYSATMPFLGILHASLDLGLYVSSLLHPVYALTGSLMFLAGWSVQAGFWAQCDLTSNRETATQGQCYQSYIQTQPKNGDLVGISTTLTNAKVGFGFLLLIMYIMYVSFAAIAVHKQRIRHKNPMTSAKGLDPEGESIHM